MRLDIRRQDAIKQGTESLGVRTKVKVVKNKLAPPFREAEFDVIYGEGISKAGTVLDAGVEQGLIEKSGTWYTYKSERIGQGRENAKKWLQENAAALLDLEAKLRDALGLVRPAGQWSTDHGARLQRALDHGGRAGRVRPPSQGECPAGLAYPRAAASPRPTSASSPPSTWTASRAGASPSALRHAPRREGVEPAYSVPNFGRFRVDMFLSLGASEPSCARSRPRSRRSRSSGSPRCSGRLVMERRGIVLVTGVTGSGKSTTLAAMIDYINRTRNDHIVSLEDPIEFSHDDVSLVISQREIGHDSASFATALRAALREDPDVILVGEMRDPETMSVALHAAETGHLVFSTLHTLNASGTVTGHRRLPAHQGAVRDQLAAVIVGVVSQRLVGSDLGRRARPCRRGARRHRRHPRLRPRARAGPPRCPP